MQHLVLTLILSVFCVGVAASEANSVKTFRDWKQEKIQLINQRMSQSKIQLEALKGRKMAETKAGRTSSYDGLIQHYEKEIGQEQWNLEVAQDLSVTEYIALYLSGHTSKTRFQEAATHLNASEVAELIEAYSEALDAANPPALAGASKVIGKPIQSPSAALNSLR